jgi:hypothetical protein
LLVTPRFATHAARLACVAVALLCGGAAGCGKKGPPLAPLSLAPEAPQGVKARRLGDTVYLQITVPVKSAAGTGPYSVDHLDIYAVTLAPDAPTPANRDLLKPQFVIAKIPVRPPVDPDAEPVEGEDTDTRAKPGDAITFVEELTPALFEPQQVSKPEPVIAPPVPPAAAPPPPAAAVPAAPAPPATLTRLYVVQGVAKNGTRGPASVRTSVPLLTPPGPAQPGSSTFDATSVTVTWQPPVTRSDEAPGVTYNIYEVPAAGSGAAAAPVAAPVPLNPAPIAETAFRREGAVPGQEQCFVVRSVATIGTASIESAPSPPICVTPRDTFPPAAPKGLAAVSGSGVINLIWDPNAEPDIAGYIVLRGEAPGDTLQPLTPAPIRDTRYADRTTRPGVTYVYAIVAVDHATPANQSALSNKVQETAR